MPRSDLLKTKPPRLGRLQDRKGVAVVRLEWEAIRQLAAETVDLVRPRQTSPLHSLICR
ncbi:hypothetical protein J3R04_001456 [Spirilliplanes yamanashiensis]|nr:hypothetical protein [Spirilliplanes yamanashiensis]